MATFISFIPLLLLSLVYAAAVFVIARKRPGVNPWPWTLGTLVPGFGLFVALVFMLLTILSVLERLNTLERNQTFS